MLARDDFGGRIQELRLSAGLTSRALDDLAGLKYGHSRQVERGMRPEVSAKTIAAIAAVFGVTSDWVFLGSGPRPKVTEVRRAVERAQERRPRKAS